MRQQLLEQGLIDNQSNYKKYSGLWANVRTRYLSSEALQYQFWLQRQQVIGWWNPSDPARKQGRLWTSIWRFAFKPFLKLHFWRIMRKGGWEGRYQREVQRWERINTFTDLEGY